MKNLRKMIAFLLAAAMILAFSVSALADEVNNSGAGSETASGTESGLTGTITITPPDSTIASASNAYKIYKVFDASGDGEKSISYRLVPGKTNAPAGFTVDTAGNVIYSGSGEKGELSEEDIRAIADYVKDDEPADIVNTTGTTPGVSRALANGYYYIATSTGAAVTISTTNPDARVTDKNTVPEISKTITNASSVDEDGKKALAQLGSDVFFAAEIIVGKGAENYVFHDRMSEGLSWNEDVTVEYEGTAVDEDKEYYSVGRVGDDTLTITFDNDYIRTLEAGKALRITYSAKITSDALTSIPAKNTAFVSYGDSNGTNRTPVSETEVYNAKFTITKQDGEGKPLAGAGFVIARKEAAEGSAENTEEKDSAAKTLYYKRTGDAVEWVEGIDYATEYISNDKGEVTAFAGLADGTYIRIEKTVPAGYNRAEDHEFTIIAGNYTANNLEQTNTVINQAGARLPSTGGIGTTIFNIIGTILVISAGVMLAARRRMEII